MRKAILFIVLTLSAQIAHADTYPAFLFFQATGYGCEAYADCTPVALAPYDQRHTASAACGLLKPKYSSYHIVFEGGLCAMYYDNGNLGGYIGLPPGYDCPYGGTIGYGTTSCVNAPSCTSPQIRNATTGACEIPPKSNGASICPNNIDIKNPINAGTGNKWQHETDLPDGAFDRYYNASTTASPSNLGAGWTHAYSRSSTIQATGTWVTIRRNDGKEYNFQQSSGLWVTDADVPDRLEELKDSANVRTGWRYTTANNSVETYTAAGKLIFIKDSSGLTRTLSYSDASTSVATAPTAGLLLRVTDSFGHQLNFTYDSNSRINSLTDPTGGVYRYAYDANNNLASVTYPDGTGKTYHYENTAFPHALTGVTDENGNRFAT